MVKVVIVDDEKRIVIFRRCRRFREGEEEEETLAVVVVVGLRVKQNVMSESRSLFFKICFRARGAFWRELVSVVARAAKDTRFDE